MISIPESVKNEYKDFNREIKVYANLYLATKTIINNEYVINYTTFPLTENNNSQILSFNINEKADIYYTSLPYNTMTIEVNNEQGYFTDYDENSIIESLNDDCYIDLFMSINNGTYYKIMTMNFDKISYNDYHKAKLSFYSNLAIIQKKELKDKNKAFSIRRISLDELIQYIQDNYKINLLIDEYWQGSSVNFALNKYNDLKTFLILCATHIGLGDEGSAIFTNNYNNQLMYKTISQYIDETITSELNLEKPIVKKDDTYKGLNYNYYETTSTEQTSETYTRTIQDTLQSNSDTIVIIDNEYQINEVTINDITSTDNVSVTVENIATQIKQGLLLTIEGNIGDEYTLQINKSNIKKIINKNDVTYSLGDTKDTSKILIINYNSCVYVRPYYFLFIQKPIKSYVEIKIMGLPYLEIGDTIFVQLDNRKIKIVITEIDTNYNDGLLQTIKGYELDWSHKVLGEKEETFGQLNDWGLLYPSNDLYPGNDLYPDKIM